MKSSRDQAPGFPSTSSGFEWLMGLLALALVGGLNLDIWAHAHGRVDESFFTPWHAVLYGSMALNGVALGAVAARNVLQYRYPFQRSLPAGYGLSLIGVIVFAIGGVLDLAWHTLFGIEEDIQALLSPTHLLLATSAALILTGPLRSAAARISPSQPARWLTHGPLVLSITATFALLGFFTQYAHPLYVTYGARDKRAPVTTSLYASNTDGSQQIRLIANPRADDWGAAISPDGRRIAYREERVGSAQSDLFVAGADGSHALRVTHSGRHDSQPAWSPDGRELAYVSAPAGTSGDFMLRTIPAAGGEATTLVDGTATLKGPSWSPDGKTIVFGSRRGQRDWIARVAARGGSVSWIDGGADGSWPAWRPDGKLIAFFHSQGADRAIFVMDATGGNPHRLSTLGMDASYPAWSPDGTRVAFVSSRDGVQQVFVMNADGTNPRNATLDAGLRADRPSWLSPNRIAFSGTQNSPYDDAQNLSLGVGSFLLQTIVLMGFVLLLVRRWRVPFGALTLVVTLNGMAMTIVSDQTFLVLWIAAAGVLGDIVLAYAFRQGAADGSLFYAFAFAFPLLYAALYEAGVALHSGLGWPANLVLGTPVVCGIAGLLLAFAFRPPLAQAIEATGH